MERVTMHKQVMAEVLKQEAFWQERLDQIRLRQALRPDVVDEMLVRMEASVLEVLADWQHLAEYVQGEDK
ncbi:hypothetical protein ASD97_26125 [Streptomyces sp. Root63]|nr:hypothetical protein ASD97_26125 [Streptomyces sp. Root63]